MLEKCHKVLALITDNIKRNMLIALCGGDLKSSTPHPNDSTPVHLLKCV